MIKEVDLFREEYDSRSLTMQYDTFNKKIRFTYYDELTNDFVQYTDIREVVKSECKSSISEYETNSING